VSETPLLDELDALGAAGVALLAACFRIVEQATAEWRLERDTERQNIVLYAVLDHLDDHPDASANAIAAAVGGRRADVLAAVRVARGET